MNWSDKANHIAENLLKEMGDDGNSYSSEKILRCLRRAAMQGMAFECDNWIFKRK